eukprot:s4335_g9.t1
MAPLPNSTSLEVPGEGGSAEKGCTPEAFCRCGGGFFVEARFGLGMQDPSGPSVERTHTETANDEHSSRVSDGMWRREAAVVRRQLEACVAAVSARLHDEGLGKEPADSHQSSSAFLLSWQDQSLEGEREAPAHSCTGSWAWLPEEVLHTGPPILTAKYAIAVRRTQRPHCRAL